MYQIGCPFHSIPVVMIPKWLLPSFGWGSSPCKKPLTCRIPRTQGTKGWKLCVGICCILRWMVKSGGFWIYDLLFMCFTIHVFFCLWLRACLMWLKTWISVSDRRETDVTCDQLRFGSRHQLGRLEYGIWLQNVWLDSNRSRWPWLQPVATCTMVPSSCKLFQPMDYIDISTTKHLKSYQWWIL